jgi:hypothetical protein
MIACRQDHIALFVVIKIFTFPELFVHWFLNINIGNNPGLLKVLEMKAEITRADRPAA